MSVISGVFIFNDKPTNGATAKLWKAAGFGSAPALDTAEPDGGYKQGATLTTSPDYGGDGSFRWESVPAGEFYVSVEYDSKRAWLFYGEPTVASILTTDGDILVRDALVLKRLAGTEGQKLYMVSGVPTWV